MVKRVVQVRATMCTDATEGYQESEDGCLIPRPRAWVAALWPRVSTISTTLAAAMTTHGVLFSSGTIPTATAAARDHQCFRSIFAG